MKKFLGFVLIIICLFLNTQDTFALSINRNNAYNTYAINRARYYPQNNWANRYQRPRPNYTFTPQQARYYGYRNGMYGAGYNNTYYYNRYRGH